MKKLGIFDNLIINPERIFGKKLWQQVASLELEDGFIKEFRALQKRYSKLIKKSQKITQELITLLSKNPKACGKNADEFVKYFNNNRDYCLESAIVFAPIPQKNITKLYSLCREYLRLKENKKIEEEIKILVKKYKLLSFNFSFTALMVAFYKDPFPFIFFDIYRDLREKIWQCLPVDAQFTLSVDPPLYPQNNESKLAIHLYDNCSLKDIEKYWGRISQKLKELRKMKGDKKRYYPQKNLSTAIKLKRLDKNKNLTDWEKSDELFGELNYKNLQKQGLVENKRRKNLKQIRHRYKSK